MGLIQKLFESMNKGAKGMKIGIISELILGILVLIISFVSLFISRRKGTENKWARWVILFGCCAIITAIVNTFAFL